MGVSDPYLLKGLTPKQSWSLLKNIITFGNDAKGVNRTLESIGWKITEKCKGIPLAIRTLGGLLQNKSEESEWINVLQGDFWKLCEDGDSIMPVLKVSYQNLSPQLRQCFAYCALFPKDCKILKDDLIHLWMAQGYLECSNEKQFMEDVSNQYVKIFLMKSFFQDAKMDRDGDPYLFKMLDLMHDLATLVAGNDCCYLDGEKKRLVRRPIHVTLDGNVVGLLDSLDASRLRTLISEFSNQLKEKKLTVVSNFKYLCALRLFYASLSKLSRSIGKLKQYLELWNCQVEERLFESISNLVCLQTLKLSVGKKFEFSTKVASELSYSSESHNLLLPLFSRLSRLWICSCPKLTRMPTFPNLDKSLELFSSGDIESNA